MAARQYITNDWVMIERDGGRYVGRIKEIRGNQFMIVFQPGAAWVPIMRSQISPCVIVPTL